MINIGKEWRWMEDTLTDMENKKEKKSKMIYRNIEKLILETPNDMELGRKIREIYKKVMQHEDHALDQVLNKMIEDLEEE